MNKSTGCFSSMISASIPFLVHDEIIYMQKTHILKTRSSPYDRKGNSGWVDSSHHATMLRTCSADGSLQFFLLSFRPASCCRTMSANSWDNYMYVLRRNVTHANVVLLSSFSKSFHLTLHLAPRLTFCRARAACFQKNLGVSVNDEKTRSELWNEKKLDIQCHGVLVSNLCHLHTMSRWKFFSQYEY